jgi:hypothetical protein
MLKDRYDNAISTSSVSARDCYVEAVDRFLASTPYVIEAFEQVVATDPGFALGHCGLARARQVAGDIPAARRSAEKAVNLTKGITRREQDHVTAMRLMINNQMPEGYRAIRAHVAEYPRDAMVAQTCSSVFGLIGFSGQPGREAEMLAFTSFLLPHYGEDWWCLSQYGFSLCETGQLTLASEVIDRSLALNDRNANGAHIRAHVHYEAGETTAGIEYLDDWLGGYDRSALLHGHLSWHVGLWAMTQGDTDRMWQKLDGDVGPGVAEGNPLNVLTDTAAMLYRAELAGISVAPDRWQLVSDYAGKYFPNTGLGFADVHAALAHAMAGNTEALDKIIRAPAGPSADLVREFSEAFGAMARQDWAGATAHLTGAMADHARLGGSRAQRDLLEHTLVSALLKQGKNDEAGRILTLRRPVLAAVCD